MALAANLFLMLIALALVAFPLLRSDERVNAAPVDAADLLADSQKAALAEAELDKALGKAEESEYQDMLRHVDRAN